MRLAAPLLLAILLTAGCAARDAPPASSFQGEPRPPTIFERTDDPPVWWTLQAGHYRLGPTNEPQTWPVVIPNGTRLVYVNVTFDEGAASGFHMALAGCSRDFDGPVPGTGVEVSTDCGGLYEGEHELSLQVGAGTLGGRVEVVAHVCSGPNVPRAHCHRLP